jgi:uncharacterized protein (TIGR00730 family)
MSRTLQRKLIDELLVLVEQLRADEPAIADLKIVHGALREMREGFRLFAPYRSQRKVSTFGSARTRPGDPVFRLAEDFARCIADRGFMVITGAGGGIMEACQRGAGRERSFGVNIQLPHEQQANTVISGDPKLLQFRYFFTRKLFFLKEADAIVLFPGGFGTHDEGFETLTLLQTGKTKPVPLVYLDRPRGTYWTTWRRYVEEHMLRRGMIERSDLCMFKVTDNVDDAVREITQFYRVYHSMRYVGEHLVLRLSRALPPSYVQELSQRFRALLVAGAIEQRRALPAERNEPEIRHLPRLVLHFDRRSFGRLRLLIDAINAAPAEGPTSQPGTTR